MVMKVVITVPAYNEEDQLGRVLEEIKGVIEKTKYQHALLVVDDGSTDKTAKIAREHGAHVVSHSRNRGLAQTFLTEMAECQRLKADIIVHTDADGQYPAKYIPQLVQKVEDGHDLVLGSRFGAGNYSGSFMKKLGNKAFARVFSSLLKTRIQDTTTGFRAFTKEVAELPLIKSFTYTQEQLIRAGKAKMRICEVPILTNKTRESRLFKSPLDYAIKAWINILRIYRDFEPLKFFGIIGLFFIGCGALIGAYISYHIMQFGNAGGIPRVILSMLLILIGVQIGLFGFLADMNRR